jgi:RNA polymerase sigma factor (TIGR02999 family)
MGSRDHNSSSNPPDEYLGGDLTRLLQSIDSSNQDAFNQLFEAVYQQFRVIARQRLQSSGGGATINTTGLVHESYLRMVDSSALSFSSSRHFFATASRVMRNIVVDYARARHSLKRGSGIRPISLDAQQISIEDQAEQLFEIDRQLQRLDASDERLAKLIELRFFGGLTEPECAQTLDVSLSTVQRDWIRAKAWFRLHCGNRPEAP